MSNRFQLKPSRGAHGATASLHHLPCLGAGLLLLTALVFVHSTSMAARPDEIGAFERVATWQPSQAPAPGGVLAPVDLALSQAGDLLVVDRGLDRVQRFGADGRPGMAYGAPGDLAMPLGVVEDAARNRVLVADNGGERIAVFDGTLGSLSGAWTGLRQPEALTLGLDGRLYTYDRGYNGIVAFLPSGAEAFKFPVVLATSSFAELPHGLATHPRTGHLFFASEAPVRDQPPVLWEYTDEGEIVPHRQQVTWNPRDLAFDKAGMFFILDGLGARLVRNFDMERPGGGAIQTTPIARNVLAIAAGAQNEVFLLHGSRGPAPAGITQLRFDGRTSTELRHWRFPPIELGWFGNPLRLAKGRDGSVVLVDELERAQQLDSGGGARTQLALPGLHEALITDGGDWLIARTRASASSDDLEDPDVAAPGMRRVRVERWRGDVHSPDPSSIPERLWAFDRQEPVTQSMGTRIVALGDDPPRLRAYALDAGHNRVLILDLESGAPLAEWALPARPGLLGYADLAVDHDGAIYVLHAGSDAILRYPPVSTPAGLAPPGPEPTLLDAPHGSLRLDADDGFVWVVTFDQRIWEYGPSDPHFAAVADLRPLAGPSAEAPSDLLALARDRLLVADRAGHQVWVLASGRPHAGVYLPWVNR